MFNKDVIPSGLSWGTRGFRVGKSVSGRWWVSLGLPLGFRYTWHLGLGNSPINTTVVTPQITAPPKQMINDELLKINRIESAKLQASKISKQPHD